MTIVTYHDGKSEYFSAMTTSFQHISTVFPILKDRQLVNDILGSATVVNVPAGQAVLKCGDFINAIPLVLDGAIKIVRENDKNEHVFLYFMTKGETCAMTLSSCLKRQQSAIVAKTLVDTSLLLIPSDKIQSYMTNYKNWNEFVLKSFHAKFDLVVKAFERSSFLSKEGQIKSYLKEIVEITTTRELSISHQELATELASNRVTISRLLKKLEDQGLVKLYRERIVVLEELLKQGLPSKKTLSKIPI